MEEDSFELGSIIGVDLDQSYTKYRSKYGIGNEYIRPCLACRYCIQTTIVISNFKEAYPRMRGNSKGSYAECSVKNYSLEGVDNVYHFIILQFLWKRW